MSLKTWMKEFFTQVKQESDIDKWTWKKCIQHTIKKWKGLTRDHLRRHGLVFDKDNMTVFEPGTYGTFDVNGMTCMLCVKSGRETLNTTWSQCDVCPIYIVTGKFCNVQYEQIMDGKPITPMIKLLEKTLKLWRVK